MTTPAPSIKYLRPYCTCQDKNRAQTRLGCRQREYEELIAKNDFDTVMKKMDVTRMCCRLAFLNMPRLFLDRESEGRYTNESNPAGAVYQNSPQILPKRSFPDFP